MRTSMTTLFYNDLQSFSCSECRILRQLRIHVDRFDSLIGSNVTFPSLPILAVFIRGALIVAGIPVSCFTLASAKFFSCDK